MTKKSGIATTEEIRQAARRWAQDEFEEPEPVKLPVLGVTVLIRKPKNSYFAINGLPLPQAVAGVSAGSKPAALAREEIIELARRTTDLLTRAFVKPKVALDPREGELSPNDLLPDYQFILRYLMGEVLAGGQDLAKFREGAAGGPDAAAGDGEDIAMPAKRAAVRKDH